jgi:hypothetical protein
MIEVIVCAMCFIGASFVLAIVLGSLVYDDEFDIYYQDED